MALAERENNLRSNGVQAAPIVALSRPFEDPVPSELAVEGVDLATLMFNYHDLGHLGADRVAMNKAVFGLRPMPRATRCPFLSRTTMSSDYQKRERSDSGIVGFYARSLSRGGYGRRSYDVSNHPTFHDFACGLMAIAVERGLWGLEDDVALKKRFPPCPLAGMVAHGAYWAPPREYEATIARYRRAGTAA